MQGFYLGFYLLINQEIKQLNTPDKKHQLAESSVSLARGKKNILSNNCAGEKKKMPLCRVGIQSK